MELAKFVVTKSLGWEAKVSLKEGIARTYAWIEQQVKAARVAQAEKEVSVTRDHV